MTSSKMIESMMLFSRRPRHEFDRVAAYLRKARYIPVGGKGSLAPQLGPHEAAILLTACLASHRAKDAVITVKKYSEVRFLHELARLLDSPELAETVNSLRIARNCTRAFIYFEDGHQKTFGEKETPPILIEVTVTGGALHQIALELHGFAQGGAVWVDPKDPVGSLKRQIEE